MKLASHGREAMSINRVAPIAVSMMFFLLSLKALSLTQDRIARYLVALLFLIPVATSILVHMLKIVVALYPQSLAPWIGRSREFRIRIAGAYGIVLFVFLVMILIFAFLCSLNMEVIYGDATVLISVLGAVLIIGYGGKRVIRCASWVGNCMSYDSSWDGFLPTSRQLKGSIYLLFIGLNLFNSVMKYNAEPLPWYVSSLSTMMLEILVIYTAIDAAINEFWDGEIGPIRRLVKRLTSGRRWVALAVTAIAVLLLAHTMLMLSFTFSPLLFKTDSVFDLPWYRYRKPIVIEVWDRGQAAVIDDALETKLVLVDLKSVSGSATPMITDHTRGAQTIINVKRGDTNELLITLDGIGLDSDFIAQDTAVISLPDRAKAIISRHLP